MNMQKITLMALPMLFATGLALAQAPQSTITESTDPAKIAEVERRAEALRRGQASSDMPAMQQDMRGGMRGDMTGGMRGDMTGDMRGEHGRMRGDRGRMHGGKDYQDGGRAHHRGMHGDHPRAAPGSGGAAR